MLKYQDNHHIFPIQDMLSVLKWYLNVYLKFRVNCGLKSKSHQTWTQDRKWVWSKVLVWERDLALSWRSLSWPCIVGIRSMLCCLNRIPLRHGKQYLIRFPTWKIKWLRQKDRIWRESKRKIYAQISLAIGIMQSPQSFSTPTMT